VALGLEGAEAGEELVATEVSAREAALEVPAVR
jgi:hypothetical protein